MIKHSLIIIILFLVTGGCKKDPPVPLNPGTSDECANFEKCDNSFPTNYYDSTQFNAPFLNPNNSDEFVYLYKNSVHPQQNGLYKFTISTKVKQQLVSNLIIFNQPKWGKNNWILFNVINGDNREIYKVKSNGDSLTQLTLNNPDLFPEWDNVNNRIIFNRQIYLGSPSSKILICNTNGVIIDSINNQYFNFGSCNQYLELALPPISKQKCGVTLVNAISKTETLLYSPSTCVANQGICWSADGEDIYFTVYVKGLYKLNKTTKNLSTIKSFCDTKKYSFISVSNDNTFFLVERIDGRTVNCNPYYKSTIYKISIDGKNEEKILME